MTAADVQRLEHERLTGTPPPPAITDTLTDLIRVLAGAITSDQAAGKWGNRGRNE
jgi:hypothetical protein